MAFELEQTAFRGRNDDGSESGASWKEAVNTNWSQLCDVNFRVRFQINSIGDTGGTESLRLQFNRNGAGWVLVNTTSEEGTFVRSRLSSNIADGQDTTDQMGSGSAFISNNNGIDEVDGQTGSATYDASPAVTNLIAEVEYCLEFISGDLDNGDTIQLRVIPGAGPPFGADISYVQTPSITVSIPTAPPETATPFTPGDPPPGSLAPLDVSPYDG